MARDKRSTPFEAPQGSPFMHQAEAPHAPGQDLAGAGVPPVVDSGPQGNEVALFAQQFDQRRGMGSRKRGLVVSIVLVIVLIPLYTILPTGIFGDSVNRVSLAGIIEMTGNNVTGVVNWLTGGPVTSGVSIVFWQTLAVAVVGAALSLNGCVYQAVLRNPLASPSTLGVMSGGTLGTLVYVLMFTVPATGGEIVSMRMSEITENMESLDVAGYLFLTQGRALFSLAGCLVVVALVLVVAHIAGRGRVSKVGLLLAGQVFAALITGVIAVIKTYLMRYGTIEQQEALRNVVGGSFSSIVSPFELAFLAVPIIVGAAIVWFMRFRLNALAFGDEEAKAMGVSAGSTRTFSIILCTILTGVVISFVGAVGFVGFLVPHLARKLVGPDLSYLVPTSMFFGAAFLLTANYVMNLTGLFLGSLGTLTSLIGAVSFLVIAIRQRARGNVDWI